MRNENSVKDVDWARNSLIFIPSCLLCFYYSQIFFTRIFVRNEDLNFFFSFLFLFVHSLEYLIGSNSRGCLDSFCKGENDVLSSLFLLTFLKHFKWASRIHLCTELHNIYIYIYTFFFKKNKKPKEGIPFPDMKG